MRACMASILVVDDELSMREFLSIFLEKQGYKVATAADGEKALSALIWPSPIFACLA